MGLQSSKKITPKQLEDLDYVTNFTQDEIKDWYTKFYTDCPSGQMTKADFVAMYEELFPSGDSKAFAEHVFRAYDLDQNGTIDFREFLCTLSVASRGTIDEKLKWVFNLYDLDGNGYVTKKEVEEIFTAIFKMRGQIGVNDEENLTPEEAVNQVFLTLDKNRDHKLTDMEFIIGAKACPEVLGILHTPAT